VKSGRKAATITAVEKMIGLAAEADDVNHAGYLLELAFQNPILRRLQIHQRSAFVSEFISINFARGGLR
jgi:hypothetical protein